MFHLNSILLQYGSGHINRYHSPTYHRNATSHSQSIKLSIATSNNQFSTMLINKLYHQLIKMSLQQITDPHWQWNIHKSFINRYDPLHAVFNTYNITVVGSDHHQCHIHGSHTNITQNLTSYTMACIHSSQIDTIISFIIASFIVKHKLCDIPWTYTVILIGQQRNSCIDSFIHQYNYCKTIMRTTARNTHNSNTSTSYSSQRSLHRAVVRMIVLQ